MTEQQENLSRVKTRIKAEIDRFFAERENGSRFYADDLHEAVAQAAQIAPASADRVMRDMRQGGAINYRVVSRRDSLYEVIK